MTFSLKAIFALLTIAGLLALVYQEKLKLAELHDQIKVVEAKIASYDPRLEKDVPLLQRAIKPDKTIDELLAHVEANVAKLVQQNQPDDLDPDQVSIFYQPTLGDRDPVKFQVYVPEELTATFEIQIVDAKYQPVDQQATDLPFQPHEPFEVQLPAGLSTMEIGLAAEANQEDSTQTRRDVPTSQVISVQLNGSQIHETTIDLADDFFPTAPRWANRDHRLDLSDQKREVPVGLAILTRQLNLRVPHSGRPEYSLKYSIRIVQQDASEISRLNTRNEVKK